MRNEYCTLLTTSLVLFRSHIPKIDGFIYWHIDSTLSLTVSNKHCKLLKVFRQEDGNSIGQQFWFFENSSEVGARSKRSSTDLIMECSRSCWVEQNDFWRVIRDGLVFEKQQTFDEIASAQPEIGSSVGHDLQKIVVFAIVKLYNVHSWVEYVMSINRSHIRDIEQRVYLFWKRGL